MSNYLYLSLFWSAVWFLAGVGSGVVLGFLLGRKNR